MHKAGYRLNDILEKLSGGDRRSIGRVDEVLADVRRNPELFEQVVEGLLNDDPLIRMRSADAIEKLTRDDPERLRPFRDMLLGRVAAIEQQEVRWHVAQMIPRLDLTTDEVARAKDILVGYLADDSKIVKTEAMQALAVLAARDPGLRPEVIEHLRELTRTGSPAMRSRGRKLLAQLGSHPRRA